MQYLLFRYFVVRISLGICELFVSFAQKSWINSFCIVIFFFWVGMFRWKLSFFFKSRYSACRKQIEIKSNGRQHFWVASNKIPIDKTYKINSYKISNRRWAFANRLEMKTLCDNSNHTIKNAVLLGNERVCVFVFESISSFRSKIVSTIWKCDVLCWCISCIFASFHTVFYFSFRSNCDDKIGGGRGIEGSSCSNSKEQKMHQKPFEFHTLRLLLRTQKHDLMLKLNRFWKERTIWNRTRVPYRSLRHRLEIENIIAFAGVIFWNIKNKNGIKRTAPHSKAWPLTKHTKFNGIK